MNARPSRAVRPLLVVLTAGCAGSAQPSPGPDPGPPPSADASPTSVLDGVYTRDQATRGRRVFVDVCGECHSSLDFRGQEFFLSWEGRTVGRLLDELIETMPDDDPGGLPTEQYLDVMAYIFQLNEFPPGATELVDAPESLSRIRIERSRDPGPLP